MGGVEICAHIEVLGNWKLQMLLTFEAGPAESLYAWLLLV